MNIKIKLLKKQEVAFETVAFWWEKPEGFIYKAGQYCEWKLNGIVRNFTLASAPFEENLMFATRMRDSDFKKILGNLNIGEEIEMTGPMGELTLDKDGEVVFLAGGIGITPFRSMIFEENYLKSGRKMTLVYTNKDESRAAFLEEFKKIPGLNFIPLYERINSQILKKYLLDFSDKIFYVVGVPEMVYSVNKMLLDLGVAKENIRTEDFNGY